MTMNSSTHDDATMAGRRTNWLLAGILAAGPVLTIALMLRAFAGGHLAALPPYMFLVTALLFWSPLPFSIPAVLLDNYRDGYLPNVTGPWRLLRAVFLVPALLGRGSPVRVAMAASLVGFAAAAWVAAPTLLNTMLG